MWLAQVSSHSDPRVLKGSKRAIPMAEAFFQAFAHVIFVNVTLANASHKAILESVWEGTTRGHGKRRGRFCSCFKIPTVLSSTRV